MFGLHSLSASSSSGWSFRAVKHCRQQDGMLPLLGHGFPQLRVEAEAGEGILHPTWYPLQNHNNRIRRGRGSSERPSRRLIYLDTYMPCGVYQENGICFRNHCGAEPPRDIEPPGLVTTVGGRDRASTSYAAANRVKAPASAARGRFRIRSQARPSRLSLLE